MKYIITESQYKNLIESDDRLTKMVNKYITFQLEPHERKYSKKYPDSIYWVKNGEVIVEIIKKTGEFWLSDVIWETITRMFSLEHDELTQFMIKWLEEHYELGGLTPLTDNTLSNYRLEEH